MRIAGSAAAILTTAALVACSGEETLSRGSAVVRDSAGVEIVDHHALPAVTPWSIAPDASLVIGGDESDAETQLYLALSATLLSNGHLAVGNSGTSQVLVFDGSGRRIAEIGRRGSGPGEFSPIMRVLPSVKSGIVAEDLSIQRKLIRFDLDGGMQEETVLPLHVAPQSGAMWDPVTSPLGTAFILAQAQLQSGDGGDLRRDPAFLIRYTYGGDGPDTLATYPGAERFHADAAPRPVPGRVAVAGPRPLVTPLFAATSRMNGGGEPWRLATGDQALAEYHVYKDDGTLLRKVRWPARGRQPTARDLQLSRTAYADARPHDPAGAQRALAGMPAVARTPVFDEIRISHTGDTWVRRYPLPTDEETFWWIFATTGQLTASILLPPGFDLLDIGATQIVARVTDELGIERIEVWLLRQGATPAR
jgi:hypothetical protein